MGNYTINQFNASINNWIKAAGEGVEDVVRLTCEDVLRDLVNGSPVYTGRFKGNWQITFNTMPLYSLNNYDQSGSDTIAKGMTQISKYAKGTGVTSIWFSNLLIYANALEYGHSQQAPNGVMGIVAVRLGVYVTNAIKKARAKNAL
ncbi:HK97 gp10 family phage protein [Gibbsiella quercinecans]|uniref:HK97 gp10 family phage protein n=1 Tax=Gibbsiella quercinecans TaxID=929813 RepID=UPI0024323648|nr:HK97 gp10 family phage protein [Gibbsiella quercinecans]